MNECTVMDTADAIEENSRNREVSAHEAPWYNYVCGFMKMTRVGTFLRPSWEKSGNNARRRTKWDGEGSGAGGRKSKKV